jgi:hypothetical protein
MSAQNFALRLIFGIFALAILRFVATALYSYSRSFLTRTISKPTAPPPASIGLSSPLGELLTARTLFNPQPTCGIVDNTNQAVGDENNYRGIREAEE